MDNLLCANCGYENDELDEINFCQTCSRAWDKGNSFGFDKGVDYGIALTRGNLSEVEEV